MFYEVRRLQINDYPANAIRCIINKSFADVAETFHLTVENCRYHPAFLTEPDIAAFLQNTALVLFGAFADKNLAGLVTMLPWDENGYEVKRLCVLPEYRHAGLGRMLMAAAEAYTREHGASKLHIDVIDDHVQLKRWYEQQGFQVLRVTKLSQLPFAFCEMEKVLTGVKQG